MDLLMRYGKPAPDSSEGWEQYSLPIGNSFLGANIFGIVERERVQITENSVENPGPQGGLNNMAELYFEFPHGDVKNYERGLDLNHAVSYVKYNYDGVDYERKFFASYPEKALVMRFTASQKGKLSFIAAPEIPYLNDEPERAKTGEVVAENDTVTLHGHMVGFNVYFEGQLKIFTDGKMTANGGKISVENATEATVIFTVATNYELRPEIFLEEDPKKKLREFDPHDKCTEIMKNACKYDYNTLYSRHEADYTSLFGRVNLELNGADVPEIFTDELLKKYSEGEKSQYLEVLYFQYGRYLLISSSRAGALPANLQGVWNVHDKSPWGSGYWHNINIQMNYWPAFSTNIAETFIPYVDFNKAFRPKASEAAENYVKLFRPEKYEKGKCGWTIGTGNYAYTISRPLQNITREHSGPGTGGLTTKLFWDYYDFTRDETVLRETVYPTLLTMEQYYTKCVEDYDGKYLSYFSASPEQFHISCYHTVGCSFDQQMIWENTRDFLRCVDILGEDTLPKEDLETVKVAREQFDKYDPVRIGWSGQVKEYREEKFYGEIGEYRHRHISQLVGLYPGTSISADTPAWRDSAAVTLDLRSDISTGWALAHRLNAWARTGDGNRAYKLLSNLIGQRTLPNLWDFHPPFQIDGNFGGTAGITEMLLQSHEEYISPLASVPDDWKYGEYSGLVARGGFEISVKWSENCVNKLVIKSKVGEKCKIKLDNIADGKFDFNANIIDGNKIEFETEKGKEYVISDIPRQIKDYPKSLKVSEKLELEWNFAEPVNIWRADDNSPVYISVAKSVSGNKYKDISCDFSKLDIVKYKITRADGDSASQGATKTVCHATKLDRERHRYLIRQINLGNGYELPEDWDK